MVKKLRKKFIRITMLSVTAVMLLLCLTVNIANFISVNSEEKKMLTAISENSGRVPSAPTGAKDEHGKEPTGEPKRGQFTAETPYTTRYFILRFDDDGNLTRAELSNIASVTADDTDEYLDAALKRAAAFHASRDISFMCCPWARTEIWQSFLTVTEICVPYTLRRRFLWRRRQYVLLLFMLPWCSRRAEPLTPL